jgi:hypothetical protein
MTDNNYFRTICSARIIWRSTRWDRYLDVYHRLRSPWKGKDIRFLDIGIWNGGSIEMWQGYFGAGSELTFLDIEPKCKAFEKPRVKIEIGD